MRRLKRGHFMGEDMGLKTEAIAIGRVGRRLAQQMASRTEGCLVLLGRE